MESNSENMQIPPALSLGNLMSGSPGSSPRNALQNIRQGGTKRRTSSFLKAQAPHLHTVLIDRREVTDRLKATMMQLPDHYMQDYVDEQMEARERELDAHYEKHRWRSSTRSSVFRKVNILALGLQQAAEGGLVEGGAPTHGTVGYSQESRVKKSTDNAKAKKGHTSGDPNSVWMRLSREENFTKAFKAMRSQDAQPRQKRSQAGNKQASNSERAQPTSFAEVLLAAVLQQASESGPSDQAQTMARAVRFSIHPGPTCASMALNGPAWGQMSMSEGGIGRMGRSSRMLRMLCADEDADVLEHEHGDFQDWIGNIKLMLEDLDGTLVQLRTRLHNMRQHKSLAMQSTAGGDTAAGASTAPSDAVAAAATACAAGQQRAKRLSLVISKPGRGRGMAPTSPVPRRMMQQRAVMTLATVHMGGSSTTRSHQAKPAAMTASPLVKEGSTGRPDPSSAGGRLPAYCAQSMQGAPAQQPNIVINQQSPHQALHQQHQNQLPQPHPGLQSRQQQSQQGANLQSARQVLQQSCGGETTGPAGSSWTQAPHCQDSSSDSSCQYTTSPDGDRPGGSVHGLGHHGGAWPANDHDHCGCSTDGVADADEHADGDDDDCSELMDEEEALEMLQELREERIQQQKSQVDTHQRPQSMPPYDMHFGLHVRGSASSLHGHQLQASGSKQYRAVSALPLGSSRMHSYSAAPRSYTASSVDGLAVSSACLRPTSPGAFSPTSRYQAHRQQGSRRPGLPGPQLPTPDSCVIAGVAYRLVPDGLSFKLDPSTDGSAQGKEVISVSAGVQCCMHVQPVQKPSAEKAAKDVAGADCSGFGGFKPGGTTGDCDVQMGAWTSAGAAAAWPTCNLTRYEHDSYKDEMSASMGAALQNAPDGQGRTSQADHYYSVTGVAQVWIDQPFAATHQHRHSTPSPAPASVYSSVSGPLQGGLASLHAEAARKGVWLLPDGTGPNIQQGKAAAAIANTWTEHIEAGGLSQPVGGQMRISCSSDTEQYTVLQNSTFSGRPASLTSSATGMQLPTAWTSEPMRMHWHARATDPGSSASRPMASWTSFNSTRAMPAANAMNLHALRPSPYSQLAVPSKTRDVPSKTRDMPLRFHSARSTRWGSAPAAPKAQTPAASQSLAT